MSETPYESYRQFICAAQLHSYIESESWSDSTVKDRLLKFVEEKVEAHYFHGTVDDALDKIEDARMYADIRIKSTMEYAHQIMIEAEDLIETSDALESATERVNREEVRESESRGGPFNKHYGFYYDVDDDENVKKAFNLTFSHTTDNAYELLIDKCKRHGELLDCVDYLNSVHTETVTADNVRNALLGTINDKLRGLLWNNNSLNRLSLLKNIEIAIVKSLADVELRLGGDLAVLDLLINSAT